MTDFGAPASQWLKPSSAAVKFQPAVLVRGADGQWTATTDPVAPDGFAARDAAGNVYALTNDMRGNPAYTPLTLIVTPGGVIAF